MQKKLRVLPSLILFSGLLATSAQAAVLFRYDFTGDSNAPSAVHANISASSLSIGVAGAFGVAGTGEGFSSAAVTNNAGAAASPPVRFVRGAGLAGSEAGAVTNDDYFVFTLDINSGYSASLTTLEFDIAVSTATTATYTGSWFLRSDADGFLSTIDSIVSVSHAANSTSNYSHVSINLGAFQDLSGDLVFRLYTFSNSTAAGRVNRIDNITLNGSVASVPEPSLSALLITGMAGLRLLSRRKRRDTLR